MILVRYHLIFSLFRAKCRWLRGMVSSVRLLWRMFSGFKLGIFIVRRIVLGAR